LKIGFEKLEKEKEKENHFSFGFQPSARLGLLAAARFLPRPPSSAWAEPSRSRRPSFTARARFPAPASLTARTHVSGASSSPRRRIPFPLFPDPIPSPQSSPFLL
jgi:hypothetical protein